MQKALWLVGGGRALKAGLAAVFLALLVSSTSPVMAGGLKHRISQEDLARVPATALESLANLQHDASMAEIALTAANQSVTGGEQDLKAAKADMKAAKASLKAAKKEGKAAEENVDADRMSAAERSVESSESRYEAAKAHYRWLKRDLKVREVAVGLREAEMELAQAQLEHAKLQLVVTHAAPVADKYVAGDFEGQVQRFTDDVTKATAKMEKAKSKADAERPE